MVLKLLENAFLIQNIESIHFYSYPQVRLLPGSYHHPPPVPPKQREITHFSQAAFFENLFPSQHKGGGGGNYGAEQMIKVKISVLAMSSLYPSLFWFLFCCTLI